MATVIYAGEKSPLPTEGDLNAPMVGESNLIEMFKEICTCGRQLSFFAYKLAVYISSGGKLSSKAAVEFFDKHSFKICCRNAMMSPILARVVSSDIGAKWQEVENPEIPPNIENAPSAIVGVEGFSVPPLVTNPNGARDELCKETAYFPGAQRSWSQI